MEKIKIREYVRTKDGIIDKVDGVNGITLILHCEKGMCIDECNRIGTHLEDIVKHSNQLIDLIEVGDYVNGSKVLAVMKDMETGELHLEMTSNYTNEEIGDCTIYDKDIKTILTKEGYMANYYKVGGEDGN